ncbi:helix-turn-helix domain-containing protein [Erwinia mallotivora]|uniref:Transcriptional regulator n=1 Tax=Erwinia mallotivora TaxID=69222 RepID=A0A014PXG4_9GAMM|nr:helix-turn-helix domain-containing protein [Erwinia mallotivora]EXU75637.1 transcriptional regulator [Erwinia mallotivora]
MNRQRMIVQDLIVWINENIRSPLKIEDVALRAGYSKWHLQRMFFRVMNISLGHYIRNKKLELAAHDLIDSSATVIDISVKYGYESQQSFTRSFVRKYRVPPAAWRRLNTDNANYLL